MNRSRAKFLVFASLFLALHPVIAQDTPIQKILTGFNKYRASHLQEKLFVHTDRTVYLAGESVWFSIYYMDGSLHKPLDVSKVGYVEILDKAGQPVAQAKVQLHQRGHGSLFLPPGTVSGTYLLRAYTHWMKNMSPDFYFNRTITVVNTFRNPSYEDSRQPDSADVKFFPEGGTLVQGLRGKIAVKAVDQAGRSFAFTGTVVNERNDTVAHFRSLKFGMGSFYFTPQPSAQYRSVIRDLSGNTSVHDFPKAQERGYSMTLTRKDNGVTEVAVGAMGTDGGYLHLISHTRSVINHVSGQALQQGKATFILDEGKLGEGISHITIFEEHGRPVCERLFFKPVEAKLLIDIKSNQNTYGIKKKVALALTTSGRNGQSVAAALSMSVFRIDSLERITPDDIADYVWLTSELKGAVESPGYYLKGKGDEEIRAVDDLMLTQGWRRFRWSDILEDTVAIRHLGEFRGLVIRGQVSDRQTGAKASQLTTFLSYPAKYGRVNSAVSDEHGHLEYEMKDFRGIKKIMVQVHHSADSLFKVTLTNPFSDSISFFRYPAFIPNKTWESSLTLRNLHMQVQNAFSDDMKPPISQKNPPDTTCFYGTPDERYYLDDYTRFTTVEDVMREYVKGVWVRRRSGKFVFVLPDAQNRTLLHDPLILVDGVPTGADQVMHIDPARIKSIDVLMRKYYYGQLIFSGIVSLKSFKADMAGLSVDPHTLSILYEGLQEEREFYAPRYETTQSYQNRIPDFRDLLYWKPDLASGKDGRTNVEFYSSEQTGTYLVVVQGISNDGFVDSGSVTIKIDPTVR